MSPIARQTILLVDDVPANIMVLDEILSAEYKLRAATSGEQALRIAHSPGPPDIILLDVMMPGIDGFEVCRQLKAHPLTRKIPVIFVTAMDEVKDEALGFELGAVDYIHKPVTPALVKARVRTHLALYDQNRELDRLVRERTRELNETRLQVIRRLGRAGEFRDNETGMHVVRVGQYCRLIAEAIGMNEEDADLLYSAAPMHDIGKIGIRDNLLLKPGKLDPEEFEEIKRHAVIGAEILGEIATGLLGTARVIALTHHEKWNGSGYPHGLSGEDIPLVGRITAIADVFDALTSERPYKHAWPVEDAVAFIENQAGEQFDPELVKTFLEILPQIVECRTFYDDAHLPGQLDY